MKEVEIGQVVKVRPQVKDDLAGQRGRVVKVHLAALPRYSLYWLRFSTGETEAFQLDELEK